MTTNDVLTPDEQSADAIVVGSDIGLPAIPNKELSQDIIKEIAMDIGKEVIAYIEVMYPEAIKATSSTFKLSVRNCIHMMGSDMGMFDYIVCEYPIDAPDTVKEWQTKDTDAQCLETYKIDAEGNLWHEEKEYEYHDNGKEGLAGLVGCMRVISSEWVKESDFRGEIVFYGHEVIEGKHDYEKWWSYSALFNDGKLLDIRKIDQ